MASLTANQTAAPRVASQALPRIRDAHSPYVIYPGGVRQVAVSDAATQTNDAPTLPSDLLPVVKREGFNLANLKEMVLVEVGPQKTTFYLHKALLVKHDYFKAVFDGHFAETEQQKLTLADDNPEFFNIVAEFLYTSTIVAREECDLIKELLEERAKTDSELKDSMERVDSPEKSLLPENKKFVAYYADATAVIAKRALVLIGAWIMAGYMLIPRLQNIIMVRLMDEFDPRKFKYHTGFDFLLLVRPCYDTTGGGAEIRNWIQTIFSDGGAVIVTQPVDDENYADLGNIRRELLHPEFLLDLRVVQEMDICEEEVPSNLWDTHHYFVKEDEVKHTAN